jgi:replicative DNA helicase
MMKKAYIASAAKETCSEETSGGITNGHDAIDQALAQIDFYHTQNSKLLGIATGFHKLDELLGGWKGGEMIVLAARPDHGKTALALSFARHALEHRHDPVSNSLKRQGHPLGIFSLDLTNKELMLRLLAAVGSESIMRINHGDLDEQSRKKLHIVANDLKTTPLFLDDSSHTSINVLRTKARHMKDRFGIEMLIIDHLDLLSSESAQPQDNRHDAAIQVSRAIKALAKELGIPIIVLVELNDPSKGQRREPTLPHLRELGAIEQIADVVLFLQRSITAKDGNTQKLDGPIFPYLLKVAKHRHGPTGSINILFHAAYTRFNEPYKRKEDRHRATG